MLNQQGLPRPTDLGIMQAMEGKASIKQKKISFNLNSKINFKFFKTNCTNFVVVSSYGDIFSKVYEGKNKIQFIIKVVLVQGLGAHI